MMDHPELKNWSEAVEAELCAYFKERDANSHPLEEAMAYSVNAGGKRIRPLMVLMSIQAVGADAASFIDMAIAPELLHTYSLIHDDLPSMDNDDLRRGQPTNHIVYGEAMAILAGDGLHTESFEVLAKAGPAEVTALQRLELIKEFCVAIGRNGMVAGQAMDLQAETHPINLDQLHILHARKTGALIRFCARMGAILGNANDEQLKHITAFAEKLGLLFQVVDDLLDRKATAEQLGKTPGKDAAQGKATFPNLIGMNQTETLADELLNQCLEILEHSNLASHHLANLATFTRNRVF